MQGTVTRLYRGKGFGFIRDADGNEYFFHRSGVSGAFDDLVEGQAVRFRETDTPKGLRAEDVAAL